MSEILSSPGASLDLGSGRSFVAVVPTYLPDESFGSTGMYIIEDTLRSRDNTCEGALLRRTRELFGAAVLPEATQYIDGSPWFYTDFAPHVELSEEDYVLKFPLFALPSLIAQRNIRRGIGRFQRKINATGFYEL